jgi:hypothetical protein
MKAPVWAPDFAPCEDVEQYVFEDSGKALDVFVLPAVSGSHRLVLDDLEFRVEKASTADEMAQAVFDLTGGVLSEKLGESEQFWLYYDATQPGKLGLECKTGMASPAALEHLLGVYESDDPNAGSDHGQGTARESRPHNPLIRHAQAAAATSASGTPRGLSASPMSAQKQAAATAPLLGQGPPQTGQGGRSGLPLSAALNAMLALLVLLTLQIFIF